MSSRDASSSTMVRAPAPPPAAAAKVSVTLQVLYGAGASACGGTAALLEVGEVASFVPDRVGLFESHLGPDGPRYELIRTFMS